MGENGVPHRVLVMLNFENYEVPVDLELEDPGPWFKLADMDKVAMVWGEGGDGRAAGENKGKGGLAGLADKIDQAGQAETIGPGDYFMAPQGRRENFILPPYSGFIYLCQDTNAPTFPFKYIS